MRLGIVGVGLIGGSFALGLRQQGLVSVVLGADNNPQHLAQAQALGIIDHARDISYLAAHVDCLLLATPIRAIAPILQALRPHLRPDVLISDVASTKETVIAQARHILGDRIAQFVPGHPIAGSHEGGPQATNAQLFEQRNIILTPLPENPPESIVQWQSLWSALGGVVHALPNAQDHDRIFAAVSHFPHLLASAYMDFMQEDTVCTKALAMGGTGFRDFTRIAAGSPELWRDILSSNREAMLSEMRAFAQVYAQWMQLMETQDDATLFHRLASAAQARRQWRMNDA